ncbi:hypothetical protein MLD38_023438 [Melastoma candidum]|uniref:Uncharacterized protein n=1 Tax=Melastoma candidum TaxID=119954 RepID=A0ACB9NRW2_9MYRT|nr:hypothetical protein MLD38_023438 [Melastoma candidum]
MATATAKDEAEVKEHTVVILPTPGMGHLIPLVELSKRLVRHHPGLKVCFLIPNDGSPSKAQESHLRSLPPSTFSYTFLPPVSFHDLPPNTRVETIISLTVSRSLPSLRSSLSSLSRSTTLLALFVDLFGTDAFEVSREFNVPPYIFFPSTATTLSLIFYLPTLDQSVDCEYREITHPVRIPGCIPLPGSELFDPVQDRKDEAYRWVLHHAKRYPLAEGILENSFAELEPGPLKYLLVDDPSRPPVFPVGPLVNMEPPSSADNGKSSECLRWLDEQPHDSVLYVSFGSGGTLSTEQMDELAHGLEMSGQRFLWVVRSPNDTVANATYFSVNNGQREPFEFLPSGFLERTKRRGLVVASWAPQAQVLACRSTGGFLTHCGWNSTLESVVNGVPLIAWPLYAEQKMNAEVLTKDTKVALRAEAEGESGVVRRGEVERVVRGLMDGKEGKEVRNRVKDLKHAASKVLSVDGSSTKALAQVVRRLLDAAATSSSS